MSKYFLIHGYGKALDLGESCIPANGGFYTFDPEIERGEAYAFVWSVEYPRSGWKPWILSHQQKLYFLEQRATESEDLQRRLMREIEEQKPTVIIAHSLGARLLHTALIRGEWQLPPSVERIVLCQADVPQWTYQGENLIVEVYHCWWDIALWSSAFLNRRVSIGLLPNRQSSVQSRFRGLYRGWNLHQDIWRDEKYKRDILS